MIVDEFIEKPKFLSLFADRKIHWANFLTLLHLLMIKHGERKFHLASTNKREFKNLCDLADTLELKWKVVTGTQLFEYQKQAAPLPQNIVDAIATIINGESTKSLLIVKDKSALDSLDGSVFSDSNVGKILEYPDCCIDWFVNNQSSDREERYAFVMDLYPEIANTPVENIIQMVDECDATIPETRNRIEKILVNHIAESRETMPFIFFQPCNVCVGPSSPARKLNDRYAKFAKERFPQLYQKIIDEGKKDAKVYNNTF
ncbi:hypothetical protein OAH42_00855 [Nitrosopumilus sp.]|nr:hypothetical protein [Nitrosopumilus sp.]MDB4850034.1 hypothetical protein [Nitrosopumilus sp.]